jgi:hypothetical protein
VSRQGAPRAILSAAILVLGASAIPAAPETWKGTIGDSMCGASHSMEGGESQTSDAACVISCVKSGEKYVLVTGGENREIENQDFPGLAEHAAQLVRVAGEPIGKKIRVTKIEEWKEPRK